MVHSKHKNTLCKNCNERIEDKFCGNCGQSADTHEINFKTFLHEIQHGIFHIDKGILYTTRELYKRPGHTIREYIQGKRVQHFKPFAYVLILSTIYALLNKFSERETFLEAFLNGIESGIDENSKENFKALGKAAGWLKNHYAYATLLLLPIVSLASYLAFIRAKFNYFQHLILNSYLAGQRTIFFLFLLPFISFTSGGSIRSIIETIQPLIMFGLTLWTHYQFFNTIKPASRIFSTILSYILFILIMLISLIIVVGIAEAYS